MGCGQSKPKLPHVVIIGGGYAGTYLAYLLQQETICKVTLVDPKDVFIHRAGVMRSIVEPEFLKALFIPFDQCASNFIRGTVVDVKKEKNTVTLKTGKKISYNYLVIATGTSSPFPASLLQQNPEVSCEEAKNIYKEFNEAMKRAHRIACVGGGLTGVELAGEIKTDYPDKQVIIFHPRDNLVSPRVNEEMQSLLKQRLCFKDVDLFLNERVVNLDSLTLNTLAKDQVVKTESGKEAEVDLVVPCTERRIETNFCKRVLATSLTECGSIKVDSNLRVEGHANIFAIGDVNNIEEEKDMFSAKHQAKVACSNLIALLTGGVLTEYKPVEHMMIITIGRYDGVGLKDGQLLDEDQCRELKGEDLYARSAWRDLGLEAPEIS